MRRKERIYRALIAADSAYTQSVVRGQSAWVGPCIHCGKKLVFSLEGEPLSNASIEHIVPRHHGGTNDLENLAIACRRCNYQKGTRHDCKPLNDPGLQQMIARLRQRKHERSRS